MSFDNDAKVIAYASYHPSNTKYQISNDPKFLQIFFKWKVNALHKSADLSYSSIFSFQGAQCRLAFHFKNDEHRLGLQYLNEEYHPFEAVVQVENESTRQTVPQLKIKKYCSNVNVKFPMLWGKTEAEVVEAYPEFCRNNHELLFQVLLKAKYGVNETDSVDTQTECDFLVNELSCLQILSEDLAQLMDQSLEPDLEFQCLDQSIKAHKLIVCSRSPVIASMMASNMLEGRTGLVKVPDIEPDVFRRLLKYIYTGILDELTFEVALSLYEAGDQYAVRGLPKRCSKFLLEHLTADNACGVLVVAEAHSDKKFKEAVVSFMVDNKVPQMYSSWPEFCSGHLELAVEVLNRLCNAVTK